MTNHFDERAKRDTIREINRIAAELGLFGRGRRKHSFLFFYPPKDWEGRIYRFAYTPWKTRDPETGQEGYFALKYRMRKDGSGTCVKKLRFAKRRVARAKAWQWHEKYYRLGEYKEEEPVVSRNGLEEGSVVEVFEDPVTCKRSEGKAKLLKLLRDSEGIQFWSLVFLNDTDETQYNRWIRKETTAK